MAHQVIAFTDTRQRPAQQRSPGEREEVRVEVPVRGGAGTGTSGACRLGPVRSAAQAVRHDRPPRTIGTDQDLRRQPDSLHAVGAGLDRHNPSARLIAQARKVLSRLRPGQPTSSETAGLVGPHGRDDALHDFRDLNQALMYLRWRCAKRVVHVCVTSACRHGTTASGRALDEGRKTCGWIHDARGVLATHQPGEFAEGECTGQRTHGGQPHSGLTMFRRSAQYQVRAVDHLLGQSA